MFFYINSYFYLIVFIIVNIACATIIHVGPTRQIKHPANAASIINDGDTVDIDGDTTYLVNTDIKWYANRALIRGANSRAHLKMVSTSFVEKALFVINGDNTIVENIEFSGAKVAPEITGIRNGAGIRVQCSGLTVRYCYFHDNEDAILGGSSGHILYEYSEFAHNGTNGYTHNMYVSHADTFTLRFCYTHHCKSGHTVKSRAKVNFILYNRIMDETTGNCSYLVDLPNGGTSYVIGNLIHQGANSENPTLITFGEEGLNNPNTDLYVVNNTMVNDYHSGTFVRVASGAQPAKVVNNLYVGAGQLLSGPGNTTTNIAGQNTDFMDIGNFDYRLTAAASGINSGSDPGSANGFSLAPAFHYVHKASGIGRTQTGALDAGAYEFESQPRICQSPLARSGFNLKSLLNPFHSYTVIRYSLPRTCHIQLAIYNNRGRLVKKLFNGQSKAGNHYMVWYPKEQASGIFFLKLISDNVQTVYSLIYLQ
jgi:hypothetical protein